MQQKHAIMLLLGAAFAAAPGCNNHWVESCKYGEVPGREGVCYTADGGLGYLDGGAAVAELGDSASPATVGDATVGAPAQDADATRPPTDAQLPPPSTEPDTGAPGADSSITPPPAPECATDAQCTPQAPVCRNEACEACGADAQCARFTSTPHCGSAGACVACRNDNDCPDPSAPLCGASSTCTSACASEAQCSRFPSTPHCGGAGACVACRNDNECPDPAAPVCGAGGKCTKSCTTEQQCARFPSAPHCGSAGACVACRNQNDCADPAAPVCGSSGVCASGCSTDAQCARPGLAGWATNVCATDRGGCVQCMPGSPSEAAQCPNGNACTMEARTCTGRTQGRGGICAPCASDSECGKGGTCIPTNFEGHPLGGHCLKTVPAITSGCDKGPWYALNATSLLGRNVYACLPLPTTSCQAINAISQSCSSDAECGAPDLPDGLCKNQRCTVSCSIPQNCPDVRICTVEKYCQ